MCNMYLRTKRCILRREDRSNSRMCSIRTGVLRNFAEFTGTHLCQSFFFNTVAGFRLGSLLKKGLWHRYFSVNFAKFLRTLFYRTFLATASEKNTVFACFKTYVNYLSRSTLSPNDIISYIAQTSISMNSKFQKTKTDASVVINLFFKKYSIFI